MVPTFCFFEIAMPNETYIAHPSSMKTIKVLEYNSFFTET